MHTNRNRYPVGIAPAGRLVWLAPLILALFGCGGGGGSTDVTAADPPEQSASIPQPLIGQWETILTYVPPFYSGPYGSVPNGDGSIGINELIQAVNSGLNGCPA